MTGGRLPPQRAYGFGEVSVHRHLIVRQLGYDSRARCLKVVRQLVLAAGKKEKPTRKYVRTAWIQSDRNIVYNGWIFLRDHRECYIPGYHECPLYVLPPTFVGDTKIKEIIGYELPGVSPSGAYFGLTNNGRLLGWDPATGALMYNERINQHVKYMHVGWADYRHTIYLTSAWKDGFFFALYDVAPLVFRGQFFLPVSQFGKQYALSISGMSLCLMYSKCIDVYRLDEIIAIGSDDRDRSSKVTIDESPMRVNRKPQLVARFPSSQHVLDFGGAPWHYITSPKPGEFAVNALQSDAPVVEGQLLSPDARDVQDDNLSFYDNKYRIMMHASQCVAVYNLEETAPAANPAPVSQQKNRVVPPAPSSRPSAGGYVDLYSGGMPVSADAAMAELGVEEEEEEEINVVDDDSRGFEAMDGVIATSTTTASAAAAVPPPVVSRSVSSASAVSTASNGVSTPRKLTRQFLITTENPRATHLGDTDPAARQIEYTTTASGRRVKKLAVQDDPNIHSVELEDELELMAIAMHRSVFIYDNKTGAFLMQVELVSWRPEWKHTVCVDRDVLVHLSADPDGPKCETSVYQLVGTDEGKRRPTWHIVANERGQTTTRILPV